VCEPRRRNGPDQPGNESKIKRKITIRKKIKSKIKIKSRT